MQAGIAHDLVAATRWFEGDHVGAGLRVEQSVASSSRERDRNFASRLGDDPGKARAKM
jgi:hypothetical protein